MEQVDVEEDFIFNNVFGHFFKDSPNEKQEFLTYLSELSSFGITKLNGEPERLKEERAEVLKETRSMAYNNYNTFIHTANSCKQVFHHFEIVERGIEDVLLRLPEVVKSSNHFLQQATNIHNNGRENRHLLQKYAQMLELLELSQLMHTCVRNYYYDHCLELLEYVARLDRKLSHIPLIQNIVASVKESKQQMLQQLLQQLSSPIQLPDCLKVVGFLRRMNVLSETQLRITFLQARDTWFQSVLQAIPTDDPYHHASKSIEVSRVHLFDISTQFRAIFSDPSFNHNTQSKENSSSLFHGWLLQKVSEFLETFKTDLEAGMGERLDSVMAQAMYFGLSFGRVGLDFRALLLPSLQKVLLPSFQASLHQATIEFDEMLKNYTLIAGESSFKQALPETINTWTTTTQAPHSLLRHPPLANYLNNILNNLNLLRSCLIISTTHSIITCLTQSLNTVVAALLAFHKHVDVCEREEFADMCVCMCVLVRHVGVCVQEIFPRDSVCELLGNLSISDHGLIEAGFGLDVEKVCLPLTAFLPTESLHLLPSLTALSAHKQPDEDSRDMIKEKQSQNEDVGDSTSEVEEMAKEKQQDEESKDGTFEELRNRRSKQSHDDDIEDGTSEEKQTQQEDDVENSTSREITTEKQQNDKIEDVGVTEMTKEKQRDGDDEDSTSKEMTKEEHRDGDDEDSTSKGITKEEQRDDAADSGSSGDMTKRRSEDKQIEDSSSEDKAVEEVVLTVDDPS